MHKTIIFTLIILMFLNSCSAIGLIGGGIVDLSTNKYKTVDSIKHIKEGDNVVLSISEEIRGQLISKNHEIRGKVLLVDKKKEQLKLQVNEEIKIIEFRHILSIDTFYKKAKWVFILTTVGLIVDFLVVIYISRNPIRL